MDKPTCICSVTMTFLMDNKDSEIGFVPDVEGYFTGTRFQTTKHGMCQKPN